MLRCCDVVMMMMMLLLLSLSLSLSLLLLLLLFHTRADTRQCVCPQSPVQIGMGSPRRQRTLRHRGLRKTGAQLRDNPEERENCGKNRAKPLDAITAKTATQCITRNPPLHNWNVLKRHDELNFEALHCWRDPTSLLDNKDVHNHRNCTCGHLHDINDLWRDATICSTSRMLNTSTMTTICGVTPRSAPHRES